MKHINKTQVPNICPKCGEINYTGVQEVKREWVHTEDDRHIRVIYIECTRCKEKMILQADTKQTISLRDKAIRLLLRRNRAEYEKADKRLTEKRNFLNEQIRGLTVYDENEKIFTEHLTVLRESDIIESDL